MIAPASGIVIRVKRPLEAIQASRAAVPAIPLAPSDIPANERTAETASAHPTSCGTVSSNVKWNPRWEDAALYIDCSFMEVGREFIRRASWVRREAIVARICAVVMRGIIHSIKLEREVIHVRI